MRPVPSLATSPQQWAVLLFIDKHLRDVGYPPTIREIRAHLGIASTNGVAEHLERLKRKGYITIGWNDARAIQLTPRARCSRCGALARGVYTCLGCRRSGCSTACLACPCSQNGGAS